jgi:hypothetical protein
MSDFTITKEQLRSLTDPKVKEMFPDAFKGILEVGKWHKSISGTIGFCENLIDGGPYFTGYCVASDGYFDKIASRFVVYKGWQTATQEEVFEALKRASIKMGYKKDLYCIFGKDKHIRAIDGNDFKWNSDSNALSIGSDCIFEDGEWAEIVNKKLL